jgi:hypothetical protein
MFSPPILPSNQKKVKQNTHLHEENDAKIKLQDSTND